MKPQINRQRADDGSKPSYPANVRPSATAGMQKTDRSQSSRDVGLNVQTSDTSALPPSPSTPSSIGNPKGKGTPPKPQMLNRKSLAMNTDYENLPVKPILKKPADGEQVASSSKKSQKQDKRRTSVKSVTIAEEFHFGMEREATQPIQPKPATITVFHEMSFVNFLVILGLWFMRFFIPWIEAWHDFNFHLLREPSYWDPLGRSTWIGEIIVFSVRCVVTIGITIFADVVNLRFFIYVTLLLLFILSPVAGAFFSGVLVARAYDQDYYSKWAFITDLLFHGAFAIAYVTFPIQLSCIFSQEQDMSRQAHYNWTAVFVFLESVNRYICFWVIPGKCPTKTYTQTAVWFAIGVTIFIACLILLNFFFDWVKPEIFILNRFWQKPLKWQNGNVEVNFKLKLRKSIWFSFILTCLLITTLVFATLERLKPDESWDKHYVLSATSMFVLGEIFGAVVMSSISSLLRWKKQKFYNTILHPDYLAMGLPHLINCLALLVLFGRFATLSQLREGDVIIGPIPGKNLMAVEFYNFDYHNRTMCVHSEFFRPMKIGPRERGTREIVDPGPTRVYFKVTTDPVMTPSVSETDSFEYQDGKWATFIITLPFKYRFDSGVEAVTRKPEVIRVEGTQLLRPQKQPRVFFMNTFSSRTLLGYKWTFVVKQKESGFSRDVGLMLKWHATVLEVPTGRLEISYELSNSSNPQTVSIPVDTNNYCVYCILLGHARPMKRGETKVPRMLKSFLTMEVAGPNSKNLPSKAQLQRDVTVMAGMTLAGMASSGFFIGMVYMFWLDTPFVAYRTVSFGMFWVFLQIPEELAKIKVVDIGSIIISVLLFLQVICIIVHFISARNFYSNPAFNFRKRPD